LLTPLASGSLRASSPREAREDESSLLTPLASGSLRASLAASPAYRPAWEVFGCRA
jgi:hypothetical protein